MKLPKKKRGKKRNKLDFWRNCGGRDFLIAGLLREEPALPDVTKLLPSLSYPNIENTNN